MAAFAKSWRRPAWRRVRQQMPQRNGVADIRLRKPAKRRSGTLLANAFRTNSDSPLEGPASVRRI
jgi:hypothetical protein